MSFDQILELTAVVCKNYKNTWYIRTYMVDAPGVVRTVVAIYTSSLQTPQVMLSSPARADFFSERGPAWKKQRTYRDE